MKKRKLLLILAAVFTIALPATVFAATSTTSAAVSIRHFFGVGVDTTKMTVEQKADVSTYTKKMADLEKEFVNKMVTNGTLTKEQGDAALKKIDDALASGTYSPDMSGYGRGHGKGMGRNGNGAGMGMNVTLTDKQKADFKEIYAKMGTNKKDLINKLVAAALITKAQGDAEISRIEEQSQTTDCRGFFGFGDRFMGFRGFGLDLSKLTTEQKTYFTDYNKKALELQKELINKAISNGAITKTQGDAMLERLQSMPTDFNDNNFGKGMRGGRGGRGMNQDNSLENKTSNPS